MCKIAVLCCFLSSAYGISSSKAEVGANQLPGFAGAFVPPQQAFAPPPGGAIYAPPPAYYGGQPGAPTERPKMQWEVDLDRQKQQTKNEAIREGKGVVRDIFNG